MSAAVAGAGRACEFGDPRGGGGPLAGMAASDQAFERLERLYGQLPAMEAKGAALARARSAAEVDRLARTAAYRLAELARAEAQVVEAEARVAAMQAAAAAGVETGGVGEAGMAERAGETGATATEGGVGTRVGSAFRDDAGDAAVDAREALMAAGTLRGLRVGPVRNAERALDRALEASPFATVAEARAALLPDDALAALAAEVEAYQRDYAEALAVCRQLEDVA